MAAKEPGRRRPVKAASRRSRARSASLDRPPAGPAAACQVVMARTCARFAAPKVRGARSATNNLDPVCFSDRGSTCALRVVPLQPAKNQCADKHLASEASANVSSLYLALHRSAFCAPPTLRVPSPKRDRPKTRPSTPAADSEQVRCSRCTQSLATARASCVAGLSEARRNSCGGCASCLQIGCRKGTSRRVSVGRGNVRCCG
jgi:hypothetical protein